MDFNSPRTSLPDRHPLVPAPNRDCRSDRGCLGDLFHNEPIPNIDVRKFQEAFLKTKQLTEGEPNIDVRNPLSSGKSLSRSPPEATLYPADGRRAAGGESGRDGKWLEWQELEGQR